MRDFPILQLTFYHKKGFVSTAGYDDESDEEESDRDTGAQNNQTIRDAGAQKTSNRDAGAQQASNRDTGARQLKTWMQMPKIVGRRRI